MSIRSVMLDVSLPFETPEDQDDSEEIILRILGVNARLNQMFLRKNPDTLPLYESGVVYTPPDQIDGRPSLKRGDLRNLLALLRKIGIDAETALMVVRLVKGTEIFLDIPALYRRGKGDCNELVPVRVAELWRAGIAASPYIVKERNDRGGFTYHAIVQWPDGSSEDPSLVLGMGQKQNADARREEIRKNAERWSTYMSAAQHLIAAEQASPEEVSHQIDSMGLAPRDGVFRSPYGVAR